MKCFKHSGSYFCADCVERIKRRIGQCSKRAFPVECDLPTRNIPTRCAGGSNCINAIVLPSGDAMGVLLGNPLTEKGFDYIGSELTVARDDLAICLDDADYYNPRELCEGCGGECRINDLDGEGMCTDCRD